MMCVAAPAVSSAADRMCTPVKRQQLTVKLCRPIWLVLLLLLLLLLLG
jgi:hypothetical protein